MGGYIMTEMIVLLEFDTDKGERRGMVLDLGTDLFQIADYIRMMSNQIDYQGAYVLSVEKTKPEEPYIPPNAFAMSYNDEKAIEQPQWGTVWTRLVAEFSGDAFDEEE